jgi:7,8-dihydropterin-6-yl-methyl-4-(beta-D-ribofuranosyl)aminobenzene 5'-phosphate synthase
MSLKITTLIENSKGEHLALKHEHGLSFHIHKDGSRILFDTGQSGAFIENARRLGVDLSGVESVVVSHGHYDHSGGVRALAESFSGFGLLVGRGFFREKYASRGGACEYLGNDFDEVYLRERAVALEILDEPHREIAPGVHAVTDFAKIHADEKVNPRFVVLENGGFVPDAFEDEVLLAIESSRGLVVLLGCSHPGVKNMLDSVRDRLGKPIYAVLGGTHLVESTERGMERTMEYFRANDIRVIGVSHCTGQSAMDRLGVLGERFYHNRTGSCLVIE